MNRIFLVASSNRLLCIITVKSGVCIVPGPPLSGLLYFQLFKESNAEEGFHERLSLAAISVHHQPDGACSSDLQIVLCLSQ